MFGGASEVPMESMQDLPCSSRAPAVAVESPPELPPAGSIWKLSRDREGSRKVQQALDLVHGDEAKAVLAFELHGHVWQAMQCPHANYVVQRCIESMPHRDCQFILDEIARRGSAGAAKAARHPYACRVLQRLLEHFPAVKLQGLVDDLLVDGALLAAHRYGTYVMQHVLEHGGPAARQELAAQLVRRARELGQSPYACMVLGKALRFAGEPGRGLLGRALFQERGLLASMAQTRHGHVAVEQLLTGSSDEMELCEVQRQLDDELPSLRVNRHGRSVLKCLEESRRALAQSQAEGADGSTSGIATGWLGGA